MSDTITPRIRGAAWVPWVATALGVAFQVIWFSSQFGALGTKVEDAERRVTFIEQNGSPTVQATRTEVSINARRISNLEELYGSKVSNLLTEAAARHERLNLIDAEVHALRQWRIEHVHDDGSLEGRINALDRQLQQVQSDHSALLRDSAAASRTRPRP